MFEIPQGNKTENPKSEARNPKQNPMIKIQMTKMYAAGKFLFGTLVFLCFVVVSDFDIRISCLFDQYFPANCTHFATLNDWV
jgi:hypothetical protein